MQIKASIRISKKNGRKFLTSMGSEPCGGEKDPREHEKKVQKNSGRGHHQTSLLTETPEAD